MRAFKSALVVIAVSQWVSAAFAVTYFPSNTTISTAINDSVDVGHDGVGGNTSPAVTLNPTGSITGDLGLFNSSQFDSIGALGKDVLLFDNSAFKSRFDTTPPIAGRVFVRGTSNAQIQSSITGSVYVEQSGSFLLGQNGNIGGSLLVSGSGKATITSGHVRGTITGNVTQNAPVIEIGGGIIEEGVAVVAVAGIAPSSLPQGNPAIPQIIFRGNSDLFIETETMNGADPAYPGRSMQLHFVSGTLLDGTVLHFLPVKIENGTGAQIVIVPEPTVLGGLMGMLALARRSRR